MRITTDELFEIANELARQTMSEERFRQATHSLSDQLKEARAKIQQLEFNRSLDSIEVEADLRKQHD